MRAFIKRQWPLFGAGLLLVLAVFYLINPGKETIQEQLVKQVASEEGLKLEDIHYTHGDPDKGTKWILDAKKVRFSDDKTSFFFHDFQLKLVPKDGPWYKLNGERGNYSKKSGVINLWGNLEGFSGNGYKITTEHMMINEKKGILNTDKLVRISGPYFSVNGKGLFADLKKEKIKLLSDVTTIVHKEFLAL